MDKKFLAILGVAVVLLVGIFIFSSNKSNAPSTSSASSVSNHTKGKTDSKVTVVEYADFQCPACGQFFPVLQQVQEAYKDKVAFTFRHFPLDTIHPNARAAARAAEAAGLQGKFFEMHDLLFQNQQSWSATNDPRSIFESYAKQLSLDIAKYNADFASETVNGTINADLKEGQDKGVTGTPSFFINGQQISNSDLSSVEKFSAKLDEALNSAN